MSDKAEVHFKDGLVMFPPHTLELMLRREREKEREECAKELAYWKAKAEEWHTLYAKIMR